MTWIVEKTSQGHAEKVPTTPALANVKRSLKRQTIV